MSDDLFDMLWAAAAGPGNQSEKVSLEAFRKAMATM